MLGKISGYVPYNFICLLAGFFLSFITAVSHSMHIDLVPLLSIIFAFLISEKLHLRAVYIGRCLVLFDFLEKQIISLIDQPVYACLLLNRARMVMVRFSGFVSFMHLSTVPLVIGLVAMWYGDDANSFIMSLILSQTIYSLARELCGSARAISNKIYNIIYNKPSIMCHGNIADLKINNLRFLDSSRGLIFDGINIEVKDGETVAVVLTDLHSKDALLSLFNRSSLPSEGRIDFCGHNITDIEDYGQCISIISDKIPIYASSLRHNISPYREISDSSFSDIVQSTCLGQLISQPSIKPSLLCSAKRKSMAIARAIAVKPSMVIVDDMSIGLSDPKEEQAIQCFLAQYIICNNTSLLLTTNPTLARDVDRIYIIHNGSVVESGRHVDLVLSGGVYANLYMYYSSSRLSGVH